jgi:hypothetical protein
MKYAFILLAFLLMSCRQSPAAVSALPFGVDKFQDGNNTCYTYMQNSISCVAKHK